MKSSFAVSQNTVVAPVLGSANSNPLLQELERRMQGPQRHRLLQGYPNPALMKSYTPAQPYQPVVRDTSRPLIVGILPHASCNPTVQGCGYCTFPHENFSRSLVKATVQSVRKEIGNWEPQTERAQVEALYFGGGTANLTPLDDMDELCQTVNSRFELNGAEITLEGAPVYFGTRNAAMLDLMRERFPFSDIRISMGVQSFDPQWVEQMGRTAIGNADSVIKAVQAAQARKMTTSADLLINLPGQSLEQMKADVRQASDLGFSQICLYHLVLFRGLGTPWAAQSEMLKGLPDNQRAFENWQEVRQLALDLGYRQTTLTNFEREGHYRYEECSYHPEKFDGIGFGPEALSTLTDTVTQTAVKWMNHADSGKYRASMQQLGQASERVFVYGQADLQLLHITRTLARLELSLPIYRQHLGSDFLVDYAAEWDAIEQAGLMVQEGDLVRFTPKGMFFSDSVTGLLARKRIRQLRGNEQALGDKPIIRMG